VVVTIIAILVGLLLPAIQTAREAARKTACANKMRQLGIALQSIHDRHGKFPPSCHVTRTNGIIDHLKGWSWIADILPDLEEENLWKQMDTTVGMPLLKHPNPPPSSRNIDPHAYARSTVVDAVICPSFRGKRYVDEDLAPIDRQAITNYKMMGATHIESLLLASPWGKERYRCRYDRYARDPDGACYPGSKLKDKDFRRDGMTNTIMATESIEQFSARWFLGTETVLVGLPTVIEYEMFMSYWAPQGFEGLYDGESRLPQIYRSYLDWDYERSRYDDEGMAWEWKIKYGPSSHHAGITNHLFVDARVQAVTNKVDPALYMFLITRDGGDPTQYFDPETMDH
jgi:hypothetical protein